MEASAKLKDSIAAAIQKADRSYFFENYTKQAAAVMKAIEDSGFKLVPKTLDDTMWKEVAETMRMGRMRPEEHVKHVFEATLKAIEKR